LTHVARRLEAAGDNFYGVIARRQQSGDKHALAVGHAGALGHKARRGHSDPGAGHKMSRGRELIAIINKIQVILFLIDTSFVWR